MKKKLLETALIFTAIFTISLISCHNNRITSDVIQNPNTASGKADMSQLPAFSFESEVHDFGKIIMGETVSYPFKFKNTGKSDLIIADVSTSCGCTVTSYNKEPIHPGKEGVIRVSFNSAGKHGYQNKSIVIVANTQPNTFVLRIKAEVTMATSPK